MLGDGNLEASSAPKGAKSKLDVLTAQHAGENMDNFGLPSVVKVNDQAQGQSPSLPISHQVLVRNDKDAKVISRKRAALARSVNFIDTVIIWREPSYDWVG
ncbi:hypothetical protein AAF712_008020 [Marasmius tenuissimus]|uniref:Uncharacterized protein n=1 Tax=Marasmius tenuissimus TaxID=585030 RepID=A0ABR2ZTL7_9AGAR